ncbi:MAG: hypothetical protein C5S41_12160 [Candidatus Methanomarinus sp.]|nr:MAG: hypothetical protein C5S41_12160 [ANME-2 cluster archaeon]
MPIPTLNLIDSTRLAVELGYTLIIVFICLLIYLKTKEIYDLTNHKGIYYFRNTFLFFGLAYLFRFIFMSFLLTKITFDVYHPFGLFMIFSLVLSGYCSTMAILLLTYSTIRKKLPLKNFTLTSNVIAIFISVVALVSRLPFFLMLSQAVLLIFTVSYLLYNKSWKISQLFILYFMLFLFWILDLFALGSMKHLQFEITIVLQILSIAVIGIIYYKVVKWIR